MINEKNSYTTYELAEERTILSFIRTCAIFCGLYILLKKNTKVYFIDYIPLIIILVIFFRIINIKHIPDKNYIYILSILLIIIIIKLIILTK